MNIVIRAALHLFEPGIFAYLILILYTQFELSDKTFWNPLCTINIHITDWWCTYVLPCGFEQSSNFKVYPERKLHIEF